MRRICHLEGPGFLTLYYSDKEIESLIYTPGHAEVVILAGYRAVARTSS